MLSHSLSRNIWSLLVVASVVFSATPGDCSAKSIRKPATDATGQTLETGEAALLVNHLIEFGSELIHGDALNQPDISMLSIRVSSVHPTDVTVLGVQIASGGSGNDALEVAEVKVWIDRNSNGKADPGLDTLVQSGTYPADEVSLPVPLSPAQQIPAGGYADVLVTYTMQPGIAPGNSFEFWIDGVNAVETLTGNPVMVNCTNLLSKYLIVGVPPISIGQAKKLPLDPVTGTSDIVMIENGLVTAYFAPTIPLAYMEQQDRSNGIGVLLSPDQMEGGAPPLGTRASLVGRLRLLGGTELVLEPIEGVLETTEPTPLEPVGITGKGTGGGTFGSQPGVVDVHDPVSPVLSKGLNSIGRLVKVCGTVTGFGTLTINGVVSDGIWIDDGSGIIDGFGGGSGIAVMKPLDWIDTLPPPSGCISVTGVLSSVPGVDGKPVRLLMPRSYMDAVPADDGNTVPN